MDTARATEDDSLVRLVFGTAAQFAVSRYTLVLAAVVFLINRIQHLCTPRGHPARLSPAMRFAVRIPSLVLIARALSALTHLMCADYATRSAQPWVRAVRYFAHAPPPAQPAVMWSAFLAACVAQCTSVLLSSLEARSPTDEPASFNLISFAFTLYLYGTHTHYNVDANAALLISLQLAELALLGLATTWRPPPVSRLALTAAFALARLTHYWTCPAPEYPTMFLGSRLLELLILAIITVTVVLHAFAMLVTEGRIALRPLLPTSLAVSQNDDFGIACVKVCTACLHATNLASMSTEIALPPMPRRTYVELHAGGAHVEHGLDDHMLPGLAREVRTIRTKHGREVTEAGGIVRGIDRVRAGWALADVLAHVLAELALRPMRAVPLPARVRAVPRTLRLLWHGTNGERAREERLAARALALQRPAEPDMDMDGAALLADAGGAAFGDIVRLHHERAEGRPLTRREYAALVAAARARTAPSQPPLPQPQPHEAMQRELLALLRERRDARPAAGAAAAALETRFCVVCCAEERSVICWPCRCIALCDECREALVHHRSLDGPQLCPTCRTPIEAYSRLYLP